MTLTLSLSLSSQYYFHLLHADRKVQNDDGHFTQYAVMKYSQLVVMKLFGLKLKNIWPVWGLTHVQTDIVGVWLQSAGPRGASSNLLTVFTTWYLWPVPGPDTAHICSDLDIAGMCRTLWVTTIQVK